MSMPSKVHNILLVQTREAHGCFPWQVYPIKPINGKIILPTFRELRNILINDRAVHLKSGIMANLKSCSVKEFLAASGQNNPKRWWL